MTYPQPQTESQRNFIKAISSLGTEPPKIAEDWDGCGVNFVHFLSAKVVFSFAAEGRISIAKIAPEEEYPDESFVLAIEAIIGQADEHHITLESARFDGMEAYGFEQKGDLLWFAERAPRAHVNDL